MQLSREISSRLLTRKRTFLAALKKNHGSYFNRILIVGDRPGPGAPQTPHYHHTPFYSIKHCSGWLNGLLEDNSIPEDELVWLNSHTYDGEPTPYDVINFMQPRVIIALGGNADRWLINGGFKHQTVYHPQYWKRFKSKEEYPLINMIRESLTGHFDEKCVECDISLDGPIG